MLPVEPSRDTLVKGTPPSGALPLLKTAVKRVLSESALALGPVIRVGPPIQAGCPVLWGLSGGPPRRLSSPCRMRDMEPIRDPKILARATQAFDLCETAEQIMKQNLRRRYPQADEREILRRFAAWVEKRPYIDTFPSIT